MALINSDIPTIFITRFMLYANVCCRHSPPTPETCIDYFYANKLH